MPLLVHPPPQEAPKSTTEGLNARLAACCPQINEIICHGIPDSTVLKDGDIVNVDITVFYDGFHGDCSETFLVGEVDSEGKRLVRVTYECLERAMKICKVGRLTAHPLERVPGLIPLLPPLLSLFLLVPLW